MSKMNRVYGYIPMSLFRYFDLFSAESCIISITWQLSKSSLNSFVGFSLLLALGSGHFNSL